MSQPTNFLPGQDPLSSTIKNLEQLVELFAQAERPKSDWMLGIEYEMFGQVNHGQDPIPYEGLVSIASLFNHLAKKTGQSNVYKLIYEGENIVGLASDDAIIALEPGGQIEVAMHPHHSLHNTISSFNRVVKDVELAANDLGIKLFSLGIHPLAKREEMAVVKKARYGVMRKYMGKLEGLGLDMMTRSCAIQINLDYQDQNDMAKKMKKAALLMPIYALLCSSSAFVEGMPTTIPLRRSYIWHKTDPLRTGIPEIIFDKDFGYLSWINFALDVPMYFIRRDNNYYEVAGASFRDFIKDGLLGHKATLRDFVDHLSTIFTEVRLKPIIELRSPDSLPTPFANALTALTWALFYDDEASRKSAELLDLDYQELSNLRNDIIYNGKKATFRRKEVFKLIENLLNIAQSALFESELAPLFKLLERNMTMDEWIKKQYKSITRDNLPKLIEQFSPFSTLP